MLKELVRTEDGVLVSLIEALLSSAGIDAVVFDRSMGSLPGAAGIVPQRIMVEEALWRQGCCVLEDAGLGRWIFGEGD